MRSLIIVLLCCMLVGIGAASALASGEWLWIVDTNPATGSLYFTGTAGAAEPIILTGVIFNNDSANQMSFDGITLKTDELIADDPALLQSLWTTDPSVEMPGSYNIPAKSNQPFTIGDFDLASAVPGIYKFKLTAAASYDTVAAQPGEITSSFITIAVQSVPEPSSLAGLGAALASFVLFRKRIRA